MVAIDCAALSVAYYHMERDGHVGFLLDSIFAVVCLLYWRYWSLNPRSHYSSGSGHDLDLATCMH